jgi:hypothetical protein
MPNPSLIPSADEIFGWIETVFAQGVRRPGYPADRWTERWIGDRFRAFGLDDLRFEPVRLPRWEDTHASLWVHPVGRPDERVQIPCFALPHCAPARIEADLLALEPDADATGYIAVEPFDLIRLPQVLMQERAATRSYDPDGELKGLTQVLPFSPRFQQVMEPAIRAGAAGFIGLLTGMPWETADYYVPYDGEARPIPGVWVSPSNGRRVVELMKAGPVRARLTVEARRETVTCQNVVGALPGASDEWIMIGSHHDGPWSSAVEDGSGIALVLAQAKYWSQVPRVERPHNLLFVVQAGHMVGGAGCRAFIEAHREFLRHVVAEIHLEHAARECRCENGLLIPTDAPEVRWWFTSLDGRLEDIVEGAVRAEDLRRSLILPPEIFGPQPTTDGGFYHLEKVPIVQYLTAPMYLFDSQDTMDKIHRPSLEAVTRATVRIVEGLAAHTAAGLREGMRPWTRVDLLGGPGSR